MRKLFLAALLVVALVCFAGVSIAIASDCGMPKCKQDTCTKPCKPKCDPCTPKADPCKPVCKPKADPCKPKCDPCKPACKPKADPCKPKCDPCKPKCKQDTCTKPCKPKCKPMCDPCKPVCEPKCSPPCAEGKFVGDYNECCPPSAPRQRVVVDDCTAKAYQHPYEACWAGDGMLCDTGCGTYLPAKTDCVTCTTVCKTVEVCDPCNPCKTRVEYVYETVCKPIMRPTVIPWWFNEVGAGNIYIEEVAEEE